jgi:hypothetical protein
MYPDVEALVRWAAQAQANGFNNSDVRFLLLAHVMTV